MPLPHPGSITVAPEAPFVPPFRPPVPPIERYFVTWRPDGGDEIILSEPSRSGWFLGAVDAVPTIVGLDMPPEEQFDVDLADGDGQFMAGRRFGARPFALPIAICSDSLTQLEGYRGDVMAAFSPRREGTLTFAYPGGERRSIRARYTAGLDSSNQGRRGGSFWNEDYTIQFKARDPFPFGDELMVPFNPPDTREFFGPPGSDYVLWISDSTTTGEREVVIRSTEDTHPRFELGGPMTSVELTNEDLNKTFRINAGLIEGQRLIINMDPSTPPGQQIVDGNGANRWASTVGMANFPVTWWLQPGVNRITVLLAGTVTGHSSCSMFYSPRFLVM